MATGRDLILAFDTATPCSTVAVTRGNVNDGQVLASLSLSSSITHSRRLIGCVDYLFEKTGICWNDIAGIGVGLGPGSFTGLRIGMSMAKGFAAVADCALVGVSTLDMIASQCITDKPLCVMIDARKKQVYTARYHKDEDHRMKRVSRIRAVEPAILAREIDEQMVFAGDGARAYRDSFFSLGDLVEYTPVAMNQPDAAVLGLLAAEQLAAGELLDIGASIPLYVRGSDAELNLVSSKAR